MTFRQFPLQVSLVFRSHNNTQTDNKRNCTPGTYCKLLQNSSLLQFRKLVPGILQFLARTVQEAKLSATDWWIFETVANSVMHTYEHKQWRCTSIVVLLPLLLLRQILSASAFKEIALFLRDGGIKRPLSVSSRLLERIMSFTFYTLTRSPDCRYNPPPNPTLPTSLMLIKIFSR